MARINFIRMNGLGNDFLIYDARKQSSIAGKHSLSNKHTQNMFSKDAVVKLCARSNTQTKGCDQLIILANSNDADVAMLVFNADGSEVFACGNASRCVVSILAKEGKNNGIKIETKAAILEGKMADEHMVSVDMGKPIFDWKKIPLAREVNYKELPIDVEGLERPFAVSMGNPHMVFTTLMEVEKMNVKSIGKMLETHELYPQKANVGFAQIVNRDLINLRVYERGAGETLACGTGACAAAVAAFCRDLCDRKVLIKTHGGMMMIEWREADDHVIMTGPVKDEGVVGVEI